MSAMARILKDLAMELETGVPMWVGKPFVSLVWCLVNWEPPGTWVTILAAWLNDRLCPRVGALG